MNHQWTYECCAFAGSIPYFAVVFILAHYVVRRARFKHALKKGSPLPGFCPSSAALGIVFLITQTFYRPSIQHAVDVRQVTDAEENDQGDPALPARQLDRQLRRIRRGEAVDTLIFRQ